MSEIFRLQKNLNFWTFTDGFQRLPRISEDFQTSPKISNNLQRLPRISQQLPKITNGEERCLMTSKQGQQQFPKDFQPILSIVKKFQRSSDDFSNVKKQLNFYLIGF